MTFGGGNGQLLILSSLHIHPCTPPEAPVAFVFLLFNSYSPLYPLLHFLPQALLLFLIIKSRHSFLSGFTLINLEEELRIVFRFYK